MSKPITTVIALIVASFLVPKLTSYFVGYVLCSVGWYIRAKTSARRELIISRARIEQEEWRSRHSGPSLGRSGEDEDWEKVDKLVLGFAGNGKPGEGEWEGIIGFFHPFCNAGGGGERVLWAAVKATQRRWPRAICAIYTGDHDVTKAAMLERVETRFNIELYPPNVVLLYLTTRKYLLGSTYPYLTLMAQSLGSLIVAYDAFNLLVPDIFIDTMGYAFTIAFSKFLFPLVPTGAYVHYPTISTDMLESLDDKTGLKGLNAGTGVGRKGYMKRWYWLAFARLYGWVGSKVDVAICNSSWTSGHIKAIWGPWRKKGDSKQPVVIFPPTAVSEIERSIEVNASTEQLRERTILYIAQFRPEKNHPLVLRAFARLLSENSKNPVSAAQSIPKLILIGSVRHSSPDETRVYNLRLLARELHISDHTTFLCDASWPAIISHLRTASVGTNAMWNEHFGISVVEYQAAGLISVVHNSGGPREDIVVDLGEGATGFRATTEEEFAAAFQGALALPKEEKVAMRARARESARRFTEEEFARRWIVEVEKLVMMAKPQASRRNVIRT